MATNNLGGSRFVRGIAIHLVPEVETIAFVAADRAQAPHTAGVFALDLANGGITIVATAIPQLVATGTSDLTYCTSVAVDSTTGRVAVGLGDDFSTEKQYGHIDDLPTTCTGISPGPTAFGVIVYRWISGALSYESELVTLPTTIGANLSARAVAIRPGTSTEYAIFLSG